MSNTPITAELMAYAVEHLKPDPELIEIADRIEAEHKRRMADMVEVVRCADCAYCQRHVDGSHVCGLTLLAHRGDYYCYFGARREVDE